jgi:hypothetical protein
MRVLNAFLKLSERHVTFLLKKAGYIEGLPAAALEPPVVEALDLRIADHERDARKDRGACTV